MATNYKVQGSDFSDLFICRDLFSQGGLWTWGRDNYGQLGDNNMFDKSSPIQTIAGGINWKQVAGSLNNTAAIKTDGTLWLWGLNQFGALGDNTTTSKSSPVQTVSTGTNWKQVACGINYTAAIKTDGTLWLWGRNNYGQQGTNNTTNRSSPGQTVAAGTNWNQVSCGDYHAAAIKTDGTLWLWGYNSNGQLGNNNTTNQSSPVQTVAGGADWKLVSSNGYHTAGIKTNGTLWLWGKNNYGQLGINNTTNQSSPVQTVAGGADWKQVVCGSYHTAAIKTDGTLWGWGYGLSGQHGDNIGINRSSPVQTIAAGTNWKQVAGGMAYTAAIKTDGTLWLWGQNGNGQLGDNTLSTKYSPVQTVSGGTNWKQVAGGSYYTAAITDIF